MAEYKRYHARSPRFQNRWRRRWAGVKARAGRRAGVRICGVAWGGGYKRAAIRSRFDEVRLNNIWSYYTTLICVSLHGSLGK